MPKSCCGGEGGHKIMCPALVKIAGHWRAETPPANTPEGKAHQAAKKKALDNLL